MDGGREGEKEMQPSFYCTKLSCIIKISAFVKATKAYLTNARSGAFCEMQDML
jgi:hypothetical protein